MEIRIKGDTLTITCSLGAGVPSKSGTTKIVATTCGFISVVGSDLKVSLNVIKSKG